jgi:hypothetical protein
MGVRGQPAAAGLLTIGHSDDNNQVVSLVMFWRTALILTLITQPALALALSVCGDSAPAKVQASSCCCCVATACPVTCPCIVRDDTPDRAPMQPLPASAPATDRLLVMPDPGPVLPVVAGDKHPSTALRQVSGAVPSARAIRTLIGVWTT